MYWDKNFEEIITYDLKILEELNLNQLTIKFLSEIGLPKDAAPLLSFVSNNQIKREGILKITDYFDFLDNAFEKYIVIGSDGNGDLIVIDTERNCEIKILNHELIFSKGYYFNSSIEEMAESVKIYSKFIEEVNTKYGEDGYLDCLYSYKDLEELKNELLKIDSNSFIEQSFWTIDLQTLKEDKAY